MDRALIVNVADARAFSHSHTGSVVLFEPDGIRWPDTGVNIQVLQPGQPNCRYHSEPVQEDFLVLHGECIVILDGEERSLRQWDFVHCPPGVDHVFVGAGEGPCAVLMIGSRREDVAHYPVNDVAARYGASVTEATDDPDEAYADWRQEPDRPISAPWPLDEPEGAA
ncbi:MAG: cupin domain-containing protein [Actinomycetota bacterium]|nr:cupin domain-containing protein [Actinomycetota bacterium]